MKRRDISIEDIAIGNIIEFYDEGFRFATVENINKIKKKISKKVMYIVVTDRYGKVPFEKIKEIYTYDGHKTTPKSLMSDIFV